MQCFVLGTGGMMPLPRRRLASVVVRPSSRMYQFDCGEGVQVSFKELRLGIKPLEVIAITHLHADHCLGLPGVLMFRAQAEDPGPLVILGPRGIERFVGNVLGDLSCHITFDIDIREWSPGSDVVAYRDGETTIEWRPLSHGVVCLGYRLEEHARPGRFDPESARALGVPAGPLWGELQRGRRVRTPAGIEVEPRQILGPPRRGRAVAYCTDTLPCPNIAELCRGVDVAFVEGMFMPEHAAEAKRKGHLTVVQAVEIASGAGAATTVLLHFSPRYGPAELKQMKGIARGIAPTASIGNDLDIIDVLLPD